MNWPWNKPLELRDSSYTDALVQAITANASGATTAFPTATAALEACAGLVGRAFASAEVEGPQYAIDALTPDLLRMVGRALIRKGEIALAIDVREGALTLSPAATIDVTGGHDQREWVYSLMLAGPSRTTTRKRLPAASVVHLRYSADPETPWRGAGPLQVAQLAGRLSAETASALADEASAPRGSILPLPGATPGSDQVTALETRLKGLRGKLLVTEAASTHLGDSQHQSSNWTSKRLGADPPDGLVALLQASTYEIMSACGVNPSVFRPGDGSGQREAWRQILFGTIAPLGRAVEAELRVKLDAPTLTLGWRELRASDLSGRARAFQSMVGGGMSVEQAAAQAGLMVPED